MIRVMQPGKLSLAILASGRGSNFEAISDAIVSGQLNAELKIVVSDKEHAPVLAKAKKRGIPAVFINPADYGSKPEYEQALVNELNRRGVNMVVLAGYMRLVGTTFLQAFKLRTINIHPALLPAFTGLHAQRQAVAYGVRYSGCTVHFVDEGMDSGPIILQAVVPVLPSDDEDSLSERILEQEHRIYWRALQLIAEGKVYIEDRKVLIKGENK